MNAVGSNPHALTDDGANDEPNWSPDGSRIAYEAPIDDQPPAIYVMNADGSNPQPLTNEDGAIDRHPSWQPLTR